MADEFVVGQIYPGNGAYPTPVQPGGIGTPVTVPQTPLQPNPQGLAPDRDGQPFETLGKWVCLSGHFINHWNFQRAVVNGQNVALVICPVCSVIERIDQGWDSIYEDTAMAQFS